MRGEDECVPRRFALGQHPDRLAERIPECAVSQSVKGCIDMCAEEQQIELRHTLYVLDMGVRSKPRKGRLLAGWRSGRTGRGLDGAGRNQVITFSKCIPSLARLGVQLRRALCVDRESMLYIYF